MLLWKQEKRHTKHKEKLKETLKKYLETYFRIKVLKSHTYILNLVYEKLDIKPFVSDKISLY